MRKKKYWKIIGEKFAGKFFLLIVLVLFTNYLSFLFRFNFQANLTSSTKGKFYWPFISQISPLLNSKEVNWSELLLIFFFGYFLVKLPAQLVLDYGQKYYERLLTVYLTKYLLTWVKENKKIMKPAQQEKLIILPNLVADFSCHLLSLLINFFSLTSNIVLNIYSLYFFVRTRTFSKPPFLFIFGFNLVILVIFVSFFFFFASDIERSKQQSWACQQAEKIQVQTWLKNLKFDSPRTNLKEIFALLDHNSFSMFSTLLASVFFRLPQLIIPGTGFLFCFFYYHYYHPEMNWNIYLTALNCQNIFWKISQILNLWPSWKSFRDSYSQLTIFFT